jgi:hypothetical protein
MKKNSLEKSVPIKKVLSCKPDSLKGHRNVIFNQKTLHIPYQSNYRDCAEHHVLLSNFWSNFLGFFKKHLWSVEKKSMLLHHRGAKFSLISFTVAILLCVPQVCDVCP